MAAPNNQISINVWLSPNEGPEKEGGVGGSRASSSEQPDAASHGKPGVSLLPSDSSRDPWLSSIMEDGGESGENKSQQSKIQKVPAMLRDDESNNKCFDPWVVSIGPYHRGKPELQLMEGLKTETVRQHVTESKVEVQDLYNKVVKAVGDARKCYKEGSTDELDDREFAMMMFLDGCFILQFISCSTDKDKKMNIKSHNVAFVRRDLFLLENQLPFLVLEALMLPKKDEWLEKINNFVDNTRAHSPDHHKQGGWLDRITKKLFREVPQAKEEQQPEQQPVHLLGILHAQLINQSDLNALSCSMSDWSSYRSANELKAAGIQFKPSKLVVSRTSMLLNLVAYESCPGAPDDFGVTSYLCFMDVLIDHAEDVKVLRSNGILLNFLGNDKQVAKLFNEIAKDLVPNPHAYARVKGDIESITITRPRSGSLSGFTLILLALGLFWLSLVLFWPSPSAVFRLILQLSLMMERTHKCYI
ncbi:hypothetical protein CK203_027139 [Vitis vinifera]|uniref:Uncharacterized protein n=1 Tax=Vitis vinifera TaxID=29760 RepID=A0A438I658_VITVI|nr:hypothetical protein CK203_027139 [Vitis vinifera]